MVVPHILKRIRRQILDFQKSYLIYFKVALIVSCPTLLILLALCSSYDSSPFKPQVTFKGYGSFLCIFTQIVSCTLWHTLTGTLNCTAMCTVNYNGKCIFFFTFLCNFKCFLKENLRCTFKSNLDWTLKFTFHWGVIFLSCAQTSALTCATWSVT